MKRTTISTLLFAISFLSTPAHATVTFDWATIGNPGNAGELSGAGAGGSGPDAIVGGVDYTFSISKHEVTAGQYTEFLNAVATSDPHGLYNIAMLSGTSCCRIERSGSDSSYTYSVAPDWKNRPIGRVSYFDAMRFINWLENGQPAGAQGPDTTEDGTYTITDGLSEARNPGGTYFIPNEDEWYKAAYYDPSTGLYYDYPTGTDSMPSNDLLSPDPGNNANFTQGDRTLGNRYGTTEVGEFENSESPYGTFDQGGNVREWIDAASTIGLQLFSGVRGGDWFNGDVTLHATFRHRSSLTDEVSVKGFRVASRIPEPSTLLLTAMAACGVLVRRRR